MMQSLLLMVKRSSLLRPRTNFGNISNCKVKPKPNAIPIYNVHWRCVYNGIPPEDEKKSLPHVIYIQNPLTWLINKFDFSMLKVTWDGSFSEAQFKSGTKQAISVITLQISKNAFDNLRGMLSRHALMALRREVETSWTDLQRRNIFLKANEIQLSVPKKVHFERVGEKKFCDIDMAFLGLKWAHIGVASTVLLIEILARFHRDYSEGILPDWTITFFKVSRFNELEP